MERARTGLVIFYWAVFLYLMSLVTLLKFRSNDYYYHHHCAATTIFYVYGGLIAEVGYLLKTIALLISPYLSSHPNFNLLLKLGKFLLTLKVFFFSFLHNTKLGANDKENSMNVEELFWWWWWSLTYFNIETFLHAFLKRWTW